MNYETGLHRIHRLFKERQFGRALPIAAALAAGHPADAIAQVAHAICEAELGRNDKALEILVLANIAVPDNRLIVFQTAETLNRLERYEQAERAFERSLVLSAGGPPRERSECLNGLGSVRWKQGRREEAIDAWKRAVAADPTYAVPRRNLSDLTNEYDEPAGASPALADLDHFRSIHLSRYFTQRGRGEFLEILEAEQVLGSIIAAWNSLVAPRGRELDSMTAAQKTEFFLSVEIDYLKRPASPVSEAEQPIVDKELERMNRQFHFLPPSCGRMLLDLGYPALMGAGMSAARLSEIIKGAPVDSKDEREMLTWAHEVLELLIIAVMMRRTANGRAALRDAKDLAVLRIPRRDIAFIVGEIRKRIADVGFPG